MSRTHRCSWSTDDAISCTLHFFAPATSTLTRWPSYTNLTSILSMCTRRPKLNFLPQLSSYRGQKSLTQYNIVSKNCQCILSYLRENRMVSNPLIGWEYTRRRWTFPPSKSSRYISPIFLYFSPFGISHELCEENCQTSFWERNKSIPLGYVKPMV